jgi:hypothetical protein
MGGFYQQAAMGGHEEMTELQAQTLRGRIEADWPGLDPQPRKLGNGDHVIEVSPLGARVLVWSPSDWEQIILHPADWPQLCEARKAIVGV